MPEIRKVKPRAFGSVRDSSISLEQRSKFAAFAMAKRPAKKQPVSAARPIKKRSQGSPKASPKGGDDCGSGGSSSSSSETTTELSPPDDASRCDSQGEGDAIPSPRSSPLRSLCVEESVKMDEVEGGAGENSAGSGDEDDSDNDGGNEPKGEVSAAASSEMQQAVLAESVTASLPPGPDTYEKLYEYPTAFARKLLIDSPDSAVHQANLRATLSRQVLQHDSYSGLGTASITCRQQLEAMSRCLHSRGFACKLIVGIVSSHWKSI